MTIIAIVIVILFLRILTTGFVDYWPPNDSEGGGLKVERTTDNVLNFSILCMWGADGDVAFDNCAFIFLIENRTAGPTEMIKYNPKSGWGLEGRMFNGVGTLNAEVVIEGQTSYIITLWDSNQDGHVSEGDNITVQTTEPFTSGVSYSLTLISEVDSSWSYGLQTGTYNGE